MGPNYHTARACLWVIRLLCRARDRNLARLVRQTAALYDTRPDEHAW